MTLHQAVDHLVAWCLAAPSEVTAGTVFDVNGAKTWTVYTCFSLLFKGHP